MLERFREAFFFRLEYANDVVLLQRQLRIGVAHQARQLRHKLVEEWRRLAQLVAMADRPADDTAQHVTAALVAWNDAVHDQKCASAYVIGDDVERRRSQILRAGEFRGGTDQLAEEIDLEDAVHALQYGGKALESHAGIDARLRQRRQLALGVAIELHENEVPDFDVTITFGVR